MKKRFLFLYGFIFLMSYLVLSNNLWLHFISLMIIFTTLLFSAYKMKVQFIESFYSSKSMKFFLLSLPLLLTNVGFIFYFYKDLMLYDYLGLLFMFMSFHYFLWFLLNSISVIDSLSKIFMWLGAMIFYLLVVYFSLIFLAFFDPSLLFLMVLLQVFIGILILFNIIDMWELMKYALLWSGSVVICLFPLLLCMLVFYSISFDHFSIFWLYYYYLNFKK